jgi:hypothetical protein
MDSKAIKRPEKTGVQETRLLFAFWRTPRTWNFKGVNAARRSALRALIGRTTDFIGAEAKKKLGLLCTSLIADPSSALSRKLYHMNFKSYDGFR